MAEENLNTVFQIQRIYLKDLSLEQPNSPALLLEMTAPKVDINLGVGAETISEDHYEVVLTATVTAKIGDKVLFLVEAKQAGIFEIRNIPDDQLQPIIGIACPGIVYPYLRAIVSDVCTRAGFPPVLLSEVNFQAMFEAQQAQAAAAASNGAGIIYPYLRAIVSDVCTRGGFPPVVLAEVNFQAMYEAQRAQAAAGNAPGAGTLPN